MSSPPPGTHWPDTKRPEGPCRCIINVRSSVLPALGKNFRLCQLQKILPSATKLLNYLSNLNLKVKVFLFLAIEKGTQQRKKNTENIFLNCRSPFEQYIFSFAWTVCVDKIVQSTNGLLTLYCVSNWLQLFQKLTFLSGSFCLKQPKIRPLGNIAAHRPHYPLGAYTPMCRIPIYSLSAIRHVQSFTFRNIQRDSFINFKRTSNLIRDFVSWLI